MVGNAMKELLNGDSPWGQRFAMLTNLVMLNILWLVCSIPVFTAGAATAALYHAIFQYHMQQDDAVLRPFFRAFRGNFKKATLLWLAMLALLCLVVFDVVYLVSWGEGTAVLFLLIICAVFVLGMQVHLFPLIARFEMSTKALLRTAASLVALHLPVTLFMLVINAVPFVVFACDPMLFLRTGTLWIGIWFALAAYLNGKILLKIWTKYMPPDAENAQSESPKG